MAKSKSGLIFKIILIVLVVLIALVVAALFVKLAEKYDYKKAALEFWLNVEFRRVRASLEQVMSGYVGSTADFETLAPAVPAED